MTCLEQRTIYLQKNLPQTIKYYRKMKQLQLLVYSNNRIKYNKRKNKRKIKVRIHKCVNKKMIIIVNKMMRKILLVQIKIALNGKIVLAIQIH